MSTVGDVKAALLALWQGVFDTSLIQITYGNRVTVAKDQRITIGGAVGSSRPVTLGPDRQMEEDYEVLCKVSVSQQGTVDDQQAVTDRAVEIYTGAEYAVRATVNETLGVEGVLLAMVEGDWELKEAEASETGGPLNASYEFRVHVIARYRLTL